MRLRFLASCALLAVTACGTPAEEVGDPSSDALSAASWKLSDLSILYPQPAEGEGDRLLAMVNGGAHDRVLLPEPAFKLLGSEGTDLPFLVETPIRDRLYPLLRVTSIRIDPCFEALGRLEDATSCERQIRLVAQPLLPGEPFTDASIHLFYTLTDAQFVEVLGTLRQLGRENTAAGPLGVHPVMARPGGLSSEWTERLNALILENCDGSKNLTRFTFMATGRSGKNWMWNSLKRQADGTFASVASLPEIGRRADGFNQETVGGTRFGSPLERASFPDALLDSATIPTLRDRDFTAAIDKLRRLDNPTLVSSATVACANCHVATTTLDNALAVRPVTGSLPSTFEAPSGYDVSRPGPFDAKNMHAFSYGPDGGAAVSPRTINETARIAAYLQTNHFTRSLPPALRERWLEVRR